MPNPPTLTSDQQAALLARLQVQSTPLNDPLLNTSEAAVLLGIAPIRLARSRCLGPLLLPHLKIGFSVRYKYSDCMAFLNAMRVTEKQPTP